MKDKKNQAGIALGALFGLMHTLWVVVVGLGFGQSVLNALEAGHFITSNYSITGFDPMTAVFGIMGAGITGYLIGWTFIYTYNFTGKKLD